MPHDGGSDTTAPSDGRGNEVSISASRTSFIEESMDQSDPFYILLLRRLFLLSSTLLPFLLSHIGAAQREEDRGRRGDGSLKGTLIRFCCIRGTQKNLGEGQSGLRSGNGSLLRGGHCQIEKFIFLFLFSTPAARIILRNEAFNSCPRDLSPGRVLATCPCDVSLRRVLMACLCEVFP